ncbi:MAG TPA: UMP kinase [Feifaniaceae bacterium]|nr:UMP kinase [Feifaniaceae bacterium]
MYQRVVLKLSGEAISCGTEPMSFDVMEETAKQLAKVSSLGVQLGVVFGGGNIWRGRSSGEMERNRADHMGMLATAINAIAMQDILIKLGVQCTVLSAVEMPRFCETYTARLAQELLKKGHTLLFACGTGHPYFSTDTAAALRAAELNAEALLLAKNIDAVYSADPKTDPNAVRYTRLTYRQVIENNLQATDLTAVTLCKEQNIPILAFGMKEKNGILRAVAGEEIGTLISR